MDFPSGVSFASHRFVEQALLNAVRHDGPRCLDDRRCVGRSPRSMHRSATTVEDLLDTRHRSVAFCARDFGRSTDRLAGASDVRACCITTHGAANASR
jgi:hypothetical protein